MCYSEMSEKVAKGNGFIAALDQSGGSTPKALRLYGIDENEYNGENEMYDLIHKMRERIITSEEFASEKLVGAILFEQTMDRHIKDIPTAEYLWHKKGIVPFLKIDKGLQAEENGVQLLNEIPNLEKTLERAQKKGIFGTKERSVINAANKSGIEALVAQQFDIANTVQSAGLMPILEPEVNINIADKAQAEDLLKASLLAHLDKLGSESKVMLKLSLPSHSGHYKELTDHPKVLKIVALSGGYSRTDANQKLSENSGIIASFSRALTEGLNDKQNQQEFNLALRNAVTSIYDASVA